MKKLALVLILLMSLVGEVQAKKPEHIGTQLNTEAVRLILKSGLDLMNGGKEDEITDFPAGTVSHKLTYENPDFDRLFSIVNELFGVDVNQGLNLSVYYGAGKVNGKVLPEEFVFQVKKISDEKFQIDISASIREFKASLPTLSFCTAVGCKGGNFVKFRQLSLGMTENSAPIKMSAKFDISLLPITRIVNGKKVISKVAQLKLISSSSNLSTKSGPQVTLNYFKGLYKGQEWPLISAVQVGPGDLGLSLTSKDLANEIDLYKNQLGRMIVKKASDFIGHDLASFLNEILKDKKFSPEYWGSYQYVAPAKNEEEISQKPNPYLYPTPYPMAQDNTYVATHYYEVDNVSTWSYFSTLIKDVKYGIMLSDVFVRDVYPKQLFSVLFDTDITINKETLKPISTKGHGQCAMNFGQVTPTPTPVPNLYGQTPAVRDNTYVVPVVTFKESTPSINCLQPLSPIAFQKSANGKSNIAVAFSESYLNSLLMMMHKQGILQKMMNKLAPMPGVYLGADGVKVHISKTPGTNTNHLYLVLNLFVKLEEQGWVDRNIGGLIEYGFGSTQGHFKFPLEIPVALSLKLLDGKYKLALKAGSPFVGSVLSNYHQYTSNLSDAAQTWLVNIKKKILAKVVDGLKDTIDPYAPKFAGRIALKVDDVDISEYLENIPVDFTPVDISLENTGHVVLYGKMNKLDLSKITVKGSN